jgi:calcineurin-like phosphoesterase family protein
VDQFILSHIPLHPDCVGERFKRNVHGHLHGNRIMIDETLISSSHTQSGSYLQPDPRYLCVCVEQINFTPVSFDDVMKMT